MNLRADRQRESECTQRSHDPPHSTGSPSKARASVPTSDSQRQSRWIVVNNGVACAEHGNGGDARLAPVGVNRIVRGEQVRAALAEQDEG